MSQNLGRTLAATGGKREVEWKMPASHPQPHESTALSTFPRLGPPADMVWGHRMIRGYWWFHPRGKQNPGLRPLEEVSWKIGEPNI